jgi:hypothetical protein
MDTNMIPKTLHVEATIHLHIPEAKYMLSSVVANHNQNYQTIQNISYQEDMDQDDISFVTLIQYSYS